MGMVDTSNYYYIKGQKDGAQGIYDPPVDTIRSVYASAQGIEDQKAYDAGYKHGKSQR
jgi:hypothetical protein